MMSEKTFGRTIEDLKSNLQSLQTARDLLEGFAYDSYVSPSGVLDRSDIQTNSVESTVFDYEKAQLREALSKAEKVLGNLNWNFTNAIQNLEMEIRGLSK